MRKVVYCSLCRGLGDLLSERGQKKYYRCSGCRCAWLDPACVLSPAEERKRYETHQNNVDDPRYQKFVLPIVGSILQRYSPGHTGLDFGAGTGPVISKLLRDRGYSMALFDPFFWNHPAVLDSRYDFIACCEVVEHFQSPAREFSLLRSLLKSGGTLYCMTELYRDTTDFAHWYYKNDPTHVFFYHEKTFEWIRAHHGFNRLSIEGRLIKLSV